MNVCVPRPRHECRLHLAAHSLALARSHAIDGTSVTGVHRRYTLDDRAASVYQYLPFEVPAEASGVTVTLAYDRTAGVVDLGLVAPDRFGGWSGGERSVVTVTAGMGDARVRARRGRW